MGRIDVEKGEGRQGKDRLRHYPNNYEKTVTVTRQSNESDDHHVYKYEQSMWCFGFYECYLLSHLPLKDSVRQTRTL